MNRMLTIIIALLFVGQASAQNPLNYSVALNPVIVNGLPGLQSYAFAQHDDKWLIIGGRTDGLHARQPFNSFPVSDNNMNIYVIDPTSKQYWVASVNNLPTALAEQMQSTNMNFYQDDDTLYIIGGYAFSTSANDHITFSNLTSVSVSSLVDAIIKGNAISPYFKQISDTAFGVTGGTLAKIDDTFYLIGGHNFTGRYNPMNHNTFVQKYTDQIRKFKIDNSGSQLSISDYAVITDPIHLHRRDYNLLPQIFPNREEGFMISSGVFQVNADLPFLYPVEIRKSGHSPITSFNQYLNHYHSAFANIYDSMANQMHSIFFGGMSQYYYQDGNLVKDDLVPFVKTISQITRFSDGTLKEYQLQEEMPGFLGASAEFIVNQDLEHYPTEIIKWNKVSGDTVLIGYVFGGIFSPSLNPFADNNTSTTSAVSTIYEVRLIKKSVGVYEIDGSNPFDIKVSPNPVGNDIHVQFSLTQETNVKYYLVNSVGQMITKGQMDNLAVGLNDYSISLNNNDSAMYLLTVVFDDKYYVTKKIFKE